MSAAAMPVVIVVPCYNEATRLDGTAFTAFAEANASVRFLFVNDGSTDTTAAVLRDLVARRPSQLACHELPQNRGKAEAVREGFLRAFAAEPPPAAVGFWDADLATPLADIVEFAAVLAKEPRLLAVFGSRVNLLGRDVQRRLWRHYVGRVFATAASAMLRLPIYDTQCGAKLFRVTDDMRAVFAVPFVSSWVFDVEILARLGDRLGSVGGPRLRDVIHEFPLMKWHDVAGSKLRAFDFVRVGRDMCRIWLRMGRRRR